MSIEDIDYLKKHSLKESYMFMVDSSTRNKETFLTPAEYKVQFTSPFKHVYSLDVLDASIPRTQYAIDVHNNTISFKTYNDIHEYTSDAEIIRSKVNLMKQDRQNIIEQSAFTEKYNNTYDTNKKLELINGYANLQEYLNAIYPVINNNPDNWRKYIDLDYNVNILQVGDYTDTVYISQFNETMSPLFIENLSNPGNILSTFLLYSEKPFIIDTYESTMSTVLGFDSFADPREEVKYNYIDSQVFGSILSNDYKEFTALESPIAIGSTTTVDATDSRSFQIVIEESGYVSEIRMAFGTTNEDKNLHFTLVKDTIDVFGGRILIAANELYGQAYHRKLNSSWTLINKSFAESELQVYLEAGIYTLVLNNPVLSDETPTNLEIQISDDKPVVSIQVLKQMYKIEAPGMYSLLGDRYVMLRCTEIEEHMYRSRSFEKYNMGIAKFKLSVIGYDESRFDFATIPPREFHPIGKLSQMTFRFERPDGSLYNFRGVNHTLTLALRYYVPQKTEEFTNFTLNPHYEPDFFKYQHRDSEDSEEDEQ